MNKNIILEEVILTPELANEWLSHNFVKNRNIRPSSVSKIVQDILNDRWNEELALYQDPLMLTEEGILINGQHRCWAVIKANKAVKTYVLKDVPEGIYKMLDAQTPKNAADLVNVPNKNNVAALAKIMCAVEDGEAALASAIQGKIAHSTRATRTQVVEKIESDNERIQRFVKFGQRIGIYLFNKKTQVSAALFLIDYVDRDDVMERFVFEASQMTTTSQPINAMRAYMGKCLANKNFKSDHKWAISCVLYTYESFRNNTEINSFNKLSVIFSKYDKLVFETRKVKRGKD